MFQNSADRREMIAKYGEQLAAAGGSGGPADHDLRGLDDRYGFVATLELQLVDRIARNDRGQVLIADPEADLREQSVSPHFLDNPTKLIAAAKGHKNAGAVAQGHRRHQWLVLGDQHAVDFGRRDPMVTATRLGRANGPVVDPLFQRGVRDTEAIRSGSDRQQVAHPSTPLAPRHGLGAIVARD